MSDALNAVYNAIDEDNAHESASTRRGLVKGAAATLGGMGLLGIPSVALGQSGNKPQNILNIAATAEVLATIVNTVGPEKIDLDPVVRRNVRSAAREELIHYDVLTSKGIGGKAVTKKIWVPDAVFANQTSLLRTLEVGDQIFINAYLIGTTTFAGVKNRNPALARITAEFMGAEAVHRALARQSLGKLGNDRVFIRFDQPETAPDAPNKGQSGFRDIFGAVRQLQRAGFGFAAEGAKPGRFYEFDEVKRRTPDDPDLNTRRPDF